jgi:hypothetical protein
MHVAELASAEMRALKLPIAESLRRAVRTRSSTNLIHQATQLKVDLFVAGGTPLDARQLARRMPIDLGDGRCLHIHPPEDILLQKLRWYRLNEGRTHVSP